MKSPRIVGALFVGVALVGFAFFVRANTTPIVQDAAIIVADSPRSYIRTNDADGDGMRDWEESLYGTDPYMKDVRPERSSSTAASETETPTETGAFSERLFGTYIQARMEGSEPSEEERAEFLKAMAEEAKVYATDRLFTERELTRGTENDLATLRAYGNAVARALTIHTTNTEHEAIILERALIADDATLLAPLAGIVESYNSTVADLMTISVPPLFLGEHLTLTNAVFSLLNNTRAMEGAFSDPLPAMVRFERHPADADALTLAVRALAARIGASGITYSDDEPGALWHTITTP